MSRVGGPQNIYLSRPIQNKFPLCTAGECAPSIHVIDPTDHGLWRWMSSYNCSLWLNSQGAAALLRAASGSAWGVYAPYVLTAQWVSVALAAAFAALPALRRRLTRHSVDLDSLRSSFNRRQGLDEQLHRISTVASGESIERARVFAMLDALVGVARAWRAHVVCLALRVRARVCSCSVLT